MLVTSRAYRFGRFLPHFLPRTRKSKKHIMAFLGDEDTTHDDGAGADDTDTGADDESTTDDEEDTSQNNDSEDDEDDSSSDDGKGDDGKGDSKEGTDTSKGDDSEEDDDGEEPEIRRPKTNAEWAAWRKANKGSKQKDQQKEGDKGNDDDDAGESDEDDADDLSPEDAKAIDKRIAKAVAPFRQQAIEAEVDAGISQFLNANPDFKPFEAKARRFALHPSRQNLPIKSIFYEVAGDKLLKIGADRVRKADKEARKTKTNGSATGGEQGSKSYKDMPLSDFEKELEREKTKGR